MRIFVTIGCMAVAGILLCGCNPDHTLKDVLHDPSLAIPMNMEDSAGSDNSHNNPLKAADDWIRKNLW